MHFEIGPDTSRISNGTLVYRPNDYSFAVEPVPDGGGRSVLIDDLSLEIDKTGRVITVWGMCPHTRWKVAVLNPPQSDLREVFFISDSPLTDGASVRFNKPWWPVSVDSRSGWVCIAGGATPSSSVEVLPGVILDLTKDRQLSSLWLRPRELPSLAENQL